MSYAFCIALGYGLAHVPAARWAWLEAKLKAGWDRAFGKKLP